MTLSAAGTDQRRDVLPLEVEVRWGVNEARPLRQLGEENQQLKRLVAELTPDVRALRGVLARTL